VNYSSQHTVHPVLQLVELRRTFRQGDREIPVLHGASAELYPGEAVALVGPSGAGKSTLLHIAGLLETPDGGQVIVNGYDCAQLGDADRTRMRRGTMGFVYQFHQLLPEFSALENVVIPQMIAGSGKRAAEQRAKQLLDLMGLAQRLDHRPAQLSGGEQQRTAIARALANAPRLLLADEPTGNLDPELSAEIMQLFARFNEVGVTLLIATHDLELIESMPHRRLKLVAGRIESDSSGAH
jgi:lipoprotein-releasing system ATP-binding protein